MLSEPKIEARKEIHYVAIHTNVSMKEIPVVAPPLIPEVYEWLSANHFDPAGPPLFRYLTMNSAGRLDMHVGVPVSERVITSGRVLNGKFPAGKYASAIYTGDYANLNKAHMALDEWMKKSGLKSKHEVNENGEEWDFRTESYITDPEKVKDPKDWKTEIWLLTE